MEGKTAYTIYMNAVGYKDMLALPSPPLPLSNVIRSVSCMASQRYFLSSIASLLGVSQVTLILFVSVPNKYKYIIYKT